MADPSNTIWTLYTAFGIFLYQLSSCLASPSFNHVLASPRLWSVGAALLSC